MTLRIGVLGAARIAPNALIRPARDVDEVTVAAVAARDEARARAFAAKHGIARTLPDYRALVDDPALDAVYIPLPNGLHAHWTRAALAAGKHVLCEKPFSANADEAREVAAAQAGTGLVVLEAFHYRYHPLAERVIAIARDELGPIRRVETNMCFPLPRFGDIRYQYDLAGGALMDAGCYALHFLRQLAPDEPTVTSARVRKMARDPRVDRAMVVDLRFPDGAVGRATTSMWSRRLLNISARVVGERGEARVMNFVAPQYFHRLTSTVDGRRRSERVAGEATYTYQLRAFAAAVRGEPTNLTPVSDSIATMTLIDAAYDAAGLPRRGPSRAGGVSA
jgi:predicted dehydrogenase